MKKLTYIIAFIGCILYSLVSNAQVGSIAGASGVGVGTTIALSDTSAGGAWSSSAPTIATVNASGVVTGVTIGTAIISYTTSGGTATDSITVFSFMEHFNTIETFATNGWTFDTGVYSTAACPLVILAGTPTVFCSYAHVIHDNPTSGVFPADGTGSSNGCVFWNSYINNSYEDLISPPFDLSGRGTAPDAVSFWVWRNTDLAPTINGLEVFIGTTTSTATATPLVYIPESDSAAYTVYGTTTVTGVSMPGVSGWYHYTASFPAGDTGDINYLIFQFTGYGLDWYMDTSYSDMYFDEVGWNVFPGRDTFFVILNDTCSGLYFQIFTNSYTAGQHVKTWFGNGSYLDTPLTSIGFEGICSIMEPYAASGTYTIKNILYDSTTAVDSITYSYQYNLCNDFQQEYYFDANNDCVFDSGDNLISVPILTEVDSNGISIDTISSISGLYYAAYGNPGDIYNFRVIGDPGILVPSCPVSGIITDTIKSIPVNGAIQYMGFQCPASSTGFDLAVSDVIPVTGIHDQYGYIYVTNIYSCDSIGATITLHYSQKYMYQPSISVASPLPTSYTDSTITWNISGIAVNATSPVRLFYKVWYNPAIGLLTVGDTVHSYVIVTPFAGDIDTLNNTETIIDTVKAGCDPNEMTVQPSGLIPPSAVTPLQYTINFENTGNDTAFNIYVMDTLSDNVDISTFRMVLASAPMNITKLKSGGYNIVKFDFPGINLQDSTASPSQCNGAVIFNINTVAGLPLGATVLNHAGIFFDYNPVVMTDTVEDTVGILPTGIGNLSPRNLVSIYPNPATTRLTIQTDGTTYTAYTITNTIGVTLLQQSINSPITTVDMRSLPAGMYFVNLTGDNGSVVRKVVKE